LKNNRIQNIWQTLKSERVGQAVEKSWPRWTASHSHTKRGIAITPVKFGNQLMSRSEIKRGAMVIIYQDGNVQVNHGGTEMGKGVHTNHHAIAARGVGSQ